MSDDKCRYLGPSSWTWIFVAMLLCLTVMSVHNKVAKNRSFAFANSASIIRLITR